MSIQIIHTKAKALWRCIVWGLWLCAGMGCQSELPMSSSITVWNDRLEVAVNQDLYGLTLEEINHGIDGGLYAELIQNRSF